VPVTVGHGPPMVLVPGYATRPRTYLRTAQRLAPRARVAIPDIFALPGRWDYLSVLGAFSSTVDRLSRGPVTLLAHSFGGAVALGFAARHPRRVERLVLADTLAVSREWQLAHEATSHPLALLRMATPTSALDFFASWLAHPRQLLGAAWWGFLSGRQEEIAAVAAAGVRTHVLWASRDSLVSREDGARFAAELGASFTVASGSENPVDHDWVFRHPDMFVEHLDRVLATATPA